MQAFRASFTCRADLFQRKSPLEPSFQRNVRAGEKWRLERGLARCGNEDGPVHDLPDWYFADGSPAPETPRQGQWKRKRSEIVARKERLIREMEVDIAKGNIKQFF
eukprot:TRINITY_DN3479_c0_g1_i1.p1 TRINITY_DN3479_c0_g1~~TRINITY_DN3479_c0_g1_i1.p1  ORF type:complete len:106 (-),score=30.06 TRINITY_DN3479_c0_g1_i1:70-387(-)